MMHIAVGLMVALLPQASGFDSDTTFAVSPGTKLRIHNQGGDVTIKGWDKNQVRIQADHSSRSYVDVDQRGQVLEITTRGRRGPASVVDYVVSVPAWMGLDLGGMYAEILVEGVRGPVKAQTLEGNITLRGGGESVSLETVNGRIDVSGARGQIKLHAVSEDIFASDLEGDIAVESVSGDIDMRGLDAKAIDAQTVSGDITVGARLADGGTYSLFTHSGDVTLAVPEGTNATVSVASSSGDVSSTFSLKAERATRRRHTYRLGNGSGNVDIETFSGDVELTRPGELGERRVEKDHEGGSIDIKLPNVKIKMGKRHRPDPDEDEDPFEDKEDER